MLSLLVDLLPVRLQDKAKALIAGSLSALLSALAVGLLVGEWDRAAIAGAVVGLLVGGPTYGTPNK